MENIGALLIVGAWGCGKTYHLENTVFPKLKDLDKPYMGIRVSLFGVKDTSEIPYRVFQTYLDSKVKDTTKGVIKLDKIRDWATGAVKSIPKLKDIVDLSPLFTKGNAAYSLVPNNTLICFDDIERATETLDINEILGVVNELVENRKYKVILVANKEYIDRVLQSGGKNQKKAREEKKETDDQSEIERELFYEKVVEKTIAFEPNILSIYKTLVEKYDDNSFSAFMQKEDQQRIVDPNNTKKKFRKQLQNIRTLKFAIEHFYQVWKQINTDGVSDPSSFVYQKLRNYWFFIHAIAVEQKAERLKYEDDKGLSQAINVVEKIRLGDDDNMVSWGDEDDDKDDDSSNVDFDYVKRFKKRHYDAFDEPFVFYESIYGFLTASKPLDISSVEEKADEAFNVQEGRINPANDILNKLLTKGVWSLTNEEAPDQLFVILNSVDSGSLNDLVSYFNAGIFLFGFKDLIGQSEDDLKKALTNGISRMVEKLPEVSTITKTQVKMLPSEDDFSKWIKQTMLDAIDKREATENGRILKEIEHQFMTDMASFSSSFALGEGKSPVFFQVPILERMNLQKVKERVAALEPKDVMQLFYFINFRYLAVECSCYKNELPFAQAVNDGIHSMDLTKPLLSNYLITRFLEPSINKAIVRLEKSIAL